MRNTGDIKRGTEIGLKDHHKHIWRACPDCGHEQWVMLKNGQPQTARCASCAGKVASKKRDNVRERHPNWKGGRQVSSTGYISIVVLPDNPFFAMADKRGRIFEHRLVMAQMLRRCLAPYEETHHKNSNKHDNRPENLELSTKGHHNQHHTISELLTRIRELEAQLVISTPTT